MCKDVIYLLVISAGCQMMSSAKQCLPNILPPKEASEVIRIPECMLNVRTVVFKELDTSKPCWTVSEVQLLVARRVMQGLVPSSIPRNFKMLFRFYEKAEHVLRSKLSGSRVKMYFQAYYDVIGGYIHSVVIPVLNEAYYAGNVDFQTVKSFHGLMGRIMGFLDTNGDGWAGPCDMSRIPTKVTPLPLHICRVDESCNAFVVSPEPKKDKSEQKEVYREYHQYLRKMKKDSRTWNNYCTKGFSKIPLPFLDDPVYPGAIAIPLKDHALFSLMSERSVNVLPKYYILAMRCLASPQYTEMDVFRFNFFFHKWIMKDVVPHLYDLQRWYAGFGGVMRIVETMNIRGLASNEMLPTTNRTPTCNKTMVHFKSVMTSGRDKTLLYIAIGLAVLGLVGALVWFFLHERKEPQKKKKSPGKISITSEKQDPSLKRKSTMGTSKSSSSKDSSKGRSKSSKSDELSESSEDDSEEGNGDSLVVNSLVASLCNRDLSRMTPDRSSFSSLTPSKGKRCTSVSGT